MIFYEASINGLKLILHKSGETAYEAYIDDCIREWKTKKSTQKLQNGFRSGGLFENFSFRQDDFTSDEEGYWYTQLFGGMVAMAVQLARFMDNGKTVSIEFIKKNFGVPSDVISGTKCTKCGAKEISSADIDKYITPRVVASAIVDGLEKDRLETNINELLSLQYEPLLQARQEASGRAANSNVAVSGSRTPATVCRHCGSKDIVKCRFLRHTQKPCFVALSR